MLGQLVLVARVNFHEERRCLRCLAGKENRGIVDPALSEESLRLGGNDLDRLDLATLQTVRQRARQLGFGEVVAEGYWRWGGLVRRLVEAPAEAAAGQDDGARCDHSRGRGALGKG